MAADGFSAEFVPSKESSTALSETSDWREAGSFGRDQQIDWPVSSDSHPLPNIEINLPTLPSPPMLEPVEEKAIDQALIGINPEEAEPSVGSETEFVSEETQVSVRLTFVDLAGDEIDEVRVGQEFQLLIVAYDERACNRKGVFGAPADVSFDTPHAVHIESSRLAFHSDVQWLKGGMVTEDGIDELRGYSGFSSKNQSQFQIASVQLKALETGTFEVSTNPADNLFNEVLLYGLDDVIPLHRIDYGKASLKIVANEPSTVAHGGFAVLQGALPGPSVRRAVRTQFERVSLQANEFDEPIVRGGQGEWQSETNVKALESHSTENSTSKTEQDGRSDSIAGIDLVLEMEDRSADFDLEWARLLDRP